MTHDATSLLFDQWVASGKADGLEREHGPSVTAAIARMQVGTGEKILDLGCGTGWATRLLARAASGASAVGVDASAAMVARAEELHSFTIRARYEVARFEELPFADGVFDRVFSMEALYYARDLDRTLAEAARVLAPGGRFEALLDFYAESPATARWREQMRVEGMHWLSEKDWLARLERAGFPTAAAERVVDARGPGDPADFRAGEHFPDWESWRSYKAAGTLWLRARRPAPGGR